MVHQQIDRLSSACIKTAHLRHEGLLLGVVRALSKRSLRLSSVVMEWLPTPKQTDWIPPDLSAHYISSAAVFFSFFFFTDANCKAPFEEGDNCAWVECSVWSAEPQFSFFCFAGSFPFSRCQRGPLERSGGAQTCRRKRVGEGRLRRGNRATATPLSQAWNLSGTLLSPSGEWEWKQSELRLIQSDQRVKCATLLSLMHSTPP